MFKHYKKFTSFTLNNILSTLSGLLDVGHFVTRQVLSLVLLWRLKSNINQ